MLGRRNSMYKGRRGKIVYEVEDVSIWVGVRDVVEEVGRGFIDRDFVFEIREFE